MNKRQLKKFQKKQMLHTFEVVVGECLASDDPLATLNDIRTRSEEHCKEMGFDVPPAAFDEIMNGCERIIKELRINQ